MRQVGWSCLGKDDVTIHVHFNFYLSIPYSKIVDSVNVGSVDLKE